MPRAARKVSSRRRGFPGCGWKRQRAMFADSVTLTDDYGLWWSYVTHFIHVPGYVYAYAFGDLLVRALYSRYLAEGRDFPAKYLQMLSAGRLRLACGPCEASWRGPGRSRLLGPGPRPAGGDGPPGRGSRQGFLSAAWSAGLTRISAYILIFAEKRVG